MNRMTYCDVTSRTHVRNVRCNDDDHIMIEVLTGRGSRRRSVEKHVYDNLVSLISVFHSCIFMNQSKNKKLFIRCKVFWACRILVDSWIWSEHCKSRQHIAVHSWADQPSESCVADCVRSAQTNRNLICRLVLVQLVLSQTIVVCVCTGHLHWRTGQCLHARFWNSPALWVWERLCDCLQKLRQTCMYLWFP